MKQGEEETKFVKEENKPTKQFVFQKNRKTILGAVFIILVLAIIIVAIVFSGTVIENG